MEKVFVGDKNTNWYKACRKYLDARKTNQKIIREFCEGYGIIGKDDWQADDDTLFVRAIDKHSWLNVQAKKVLYYDGNKSYYQIKKNSKLGKEFLKLGLIESNRPLPYIGLFNVLKLRFVQFIHNEHVYIEVDAYEEELKCPEMFTEMKLSDYYLMIEKIQDKSNELFLENI